MTRLDETPRTGKKKTHVQIKSNTVVKRNTNGISLKYEK
jgi:hypothetical protein